MNTVDLFVVGEDFYLGSAISEGNLKDGWCDFEALGEALVKTHAGSSRKLGEIWYLASQVCRAAQRSFAEYEKQGLWLRAQGRKVSRIIVDGGQTVEHRGQLIAGREFRCRTEDVAVSQLRRTDRGQQAMVISSLNHERASPLLSFLGEEYDGRSVVLVPPDLPMLDSRNAIQFSHSDLRASRFRDDISLEAWKKYERLKSDGKLAQRWFEDALLVLGPGLTKRMGRRQYRDPRAWHRLVRDDTEVLADLEKRTALFLPSHPVKDRRLEREAECIRFIARKLIDAAARRILDDRGVRLVSTLDHLDSPENWIFASQSASIRSGRDLIARAASMYAAIEICQVAKSQIIAMTGTEGHFGWLLKALAAANREMCAWEGGPFPHNKLPGPPTGESYSVMNSPHLRRMRCFKTGTGENLLFEHHMKHAGLNMRIHYRVDQDRRLLLIGYVGKHLPTALF